METDQGKMEVGKEAEGKKRKRRTKVRDSKTKRDGKEDQTKKINKKTKVELGGKVPKRRFASAPDFLPKPIIMQKAIGILHQNRSMATMSFGRSK